MDNFVGWLVLKTKIDTSDIKKGLNDLKKDAPKKLSSVLKDTPKKLLGVLKNVGKGIVNLFLGIAKTITSILGPAIFMGLLGGLAIIVGAVKNITKEIKINDIQQISAQIQYISNGIRGMILPVVQAVASVIKTILDYVIYIGNAWFGLGK